MDQSTNRKLRKLSADFNQESLNINPKTRKIFNKIVPNFFPEDGAWSSRCFSNEPSFGRAYLVKHLHDYPWMSYLMADEIKRDFHHKADLKQLETLMTIDQTFNDYRDLYEERVVRWQLNWMMNGGENWVIPEGYTDFSIIYDNHIEDLIRDGAIATLERIGMDHHAVEAGIEKYADIWRLPCINRSFNNEYEPTFFSAKAPAADAEFRNNFVTLREHEYYEKHRAAVDVYGVKTPAMELDAKAIAELRTIVDEQSTARKTFLENWKEIQNLEAQEIEK